MTARRIARLYNAGLVVTAAKIPLIVLTGFLGAGKTSLINRVLAARAATDDHDGTLAIIVNELGAIGIDADLLPRGATRQVELPGGCVCCVLADDLDRTIVELLDSNPTIDTIVLETTGVAEPVPIVWTLERPPVDARVRVAAIVTVVDPLSWLEACATSTVAEIQVESADVVVMTKLDVADAALIAQTEVAIARLAPHAPVVAMSPAAAATWLLAMLRDPPDRSDAAAHDHTAHDHAAHDHAAHDHAGGVLHGVTSAAVSCDDSLDLEAFEDAIASLPRTYFRVKAIVHALDPRRGDPRGWYVVHRVGGRVSSESIAAPSGSGRIVGLGIDVAAPPLAACIATAVLPSPPGSR
jgi:G3E family GTPase